MIGKGKSISHGVAALEYDLAKEINGQAVATEIARHELYGCTGAEMVQEMKPYHIDFPNVKNNCLRFEVSPSIEESATFTDADWAELGNDFMQRMGLANHQYIIIRHSGTESKKEQAHLHILANRVSLSGELYRDNWIGKKATEAANAIAKERNFVQSQDIGKVNKAEIKEAMDGVLKKMQGFDFTKFKEELGKRGFKVREARASTGKLNGYYVTARSGTEYKASEIGKGYTLAHIERTQSKLKCNSMNISHGNKLTPGSGSFHEGVPVFGVIYVPVKETLYWGEVATGAYKMEGVTGRAGRSLEEMKASAFRMPCAETNEVFVIVASRSHLSAETEEYIEEKRKIYPHVELVSVGSSIKICKVCEGLADEYPRFAPTMEWDTAAGHAIAKASGAEIYQAGKEEPLKYNKPDLLNPWFVVKRN